MRNVGLHLSIIIKSTFVLRDSMIVKIKAGFCYRKYNDSVLILIRLNANIARTPEPLI